MTNAKRVWVVDDEPDVLTYLTTALEDEDYEVRYFSQVDGFLDEAKSSPPDLICLDIMMPSRSGLSLYRELRSSESFRAIPVVMVSGYSREEEFLNGEFEHLVGGGSDIPKPDGFVEKPIAMEEFLGLVKSLLARRNA